MDKMSGGGESGPQFEAPPATQSNESGDQQQIEQNHPASPETASKAPAQTTPSLPVPQMPIAQPPAQTTTDQPAKDNLSDVKTAGLPAADNHRIEQEWVNKTKEVINQTRSDPFTQKNEVSRIKADYMKKRFNKTIKTDDTVAA